MNKNKILVVARKKFEIPLSHVEGSEGYYTYGAYTLWARIKAVYYVIKYLFL